jgi:hypothetical protein
MTSERFVLCDENSWRTITTQVQQARHEQDPVHQATIDRLMRKYLYLLYPLRTFIDEAMRRPTSMHYKRAFVDMKEPYIAYCVKKCPANAVNCDWKNGWKLPQ